MATSFCEDDDQTPPLDPEQKDALGSGDVEGFRRRLTQEQQPLLLVLAAQHRGDQVIKALLDNPPEDLNVNACDKKGNTALHYSAWNGSLESVILLLSSGADPLQKNCLENVALGEKETKTLLDQCIRTNGKRHWDENYRIIFDYRLLLSLSVDRRRSSSSGLTGLLCCNGERAERVNEEEQISFQNGKRESGAARPQRSRIFQTEMKLLEIFCRHKRKILLDHPVVASFHSLKWKRMKRYAYVNLVAYIGFLISLNVYLSLHVGENMEDLEEALKKPKYQRTFDLILPFITKIVLIIFTLYFLSRELVQLYSNWKRYITSHENYIDLALLIFTIWKVSYPSWHYVYWVDVATVMLSCIELLDMISRVSKFAKYIHMLKVVLQTYFFISLPYAAILWAFALSFHTVFTNERLKGIDNSTAETFQTFPMSLVKVIVMMSGELETESVPLEKTVLGIVLFVSFVLLVTIVLLNLLIGLTVSDTEVIKEDAGVLWIRTRVNTIVDIETVSVNLANRHRCLVWLKSVLLFPEHWDSDGNLVKMEAWVRPNGDATLNLGCRTGGEGEAVEVGELTCQDNHAVVERAQRILRERHRGRDGGAHSGVAENVAKILELVNRLVGVQNNIMRGDDQGDSIWDGLSRPTQ